MQHNLLIIFIALCIATSCRPVVKDEVKTVDPPASTMPDSSIAPMLTRLWETEKKLSTAESVFHDTTNNVLYVSCMGNLPPDKKDGDGFIARVSMDGKITDLKWVTGLSSPRGMGMVGNLLYVTDIDRIVAIDTKSGKINNTWQVSGASSLNDIATSEEGVIYISDSNKSTFFRLAKGKVTLMLTDTTMHGTNGLHVDGKTLLIAGDGSTYAVDIEGLGVEKLAEGIPSGDGIERYGDGIIQSSWSGEIFYIDTTGTTTKILDTKDVKLNTADIEIVENKNLILVPTFFGNSVTAYSIK